MDACSIILRVFSYLPDNIKNNNFLLESFEEIRKKITDNSFFPSKISVSSEYYEKMATDDLLSDSIVKAFDDSFVSFSLISEGVTYSITIKGKDNLAIDADMRSKDNHVMTLYIESEDTIGVVTEVVDEVGNYNSDVYIYDKNFEFLGYGDESQKNYYFSRRFNIAESYAEEIRLNFRRYVKRFGLDSSVPEDDLYILSSPLSLINIKEFMNNLLDQRSYVVSTSSEDIAARRNYLNNLINIFANKVGLEDVVMTDGLVQLLTGIPSNENLEHSIIIKKVGENFVLYKVSFITVGSVDIDVQEISADKVLELYNSSSLNCDVVGLKEYLGLTRK